MPRFKRLDSDLSRSANGVLKVAQQLLEGVSFMHANGIVHRDINLGNLVVDTNHDYLYIIDCDLAMHFEGKGVTVSGFVGTDGYTAPEVGKVNGKAQTYDAVQADLWATGFILQTLSRWSPDRSALTRIGLDEVYQSLMDNDPKQRPSAKDTLAMLLTASVGEVGEDSAPSFSVN
jgi:serine/threonine protein kinase